MGLFKGIKSTYKKSEAAVIIQNLMDIQIAAGLCELDPAKTSNRLVAEVWDGSPHFFDGRFGQRPHKLSVVAAALANAIEELGFENRHTNTFAICLGQVLNEATTKASLYPFNKLDDDLLTTSANTYLAYSKALEDSSLGRYIDVLLQSKDD